MGRKKLKVKKKRKSMLSDHTLYNSGFCVTDNKNFALFEFPDDFFVDNGIKSVLDFELTEFDLSMLIDRHKKLKPSRGNIKVSFGDEFGLVKRIYFNLFPDCEFYPVTEWFGQASNRLIVGLPDSVGKPIGVLKTVKKEDN